MITLFIVLILLGALLAVICTGAIVLIDPIIAILCVCGIYKFVKWVVRKLKG